MRTTRLLVFASVATWVLALGWVAAAPDDRRERDERREVEKHHADDDDDPRIEQGLNIAPVFLTYDKHKRSLVGLGSYLVNAMGDCNGCHSAGPATEDVGGSNPFLRGQSKLVNTATYLGGGRDFGQIGPVDPADVTAGKHIPPHIVSRNLTPDTTGLPEGGASFSEFHDSIRFGTDADQLHPNCNTALGITDNCFKPPFDGTKLQVMPWPAHQDWTNHDLLAIYEYRKRSRASRELYSASKRYARHEHTQVLLKSL